jgi:hypothetical protein
VQLGGNNAGTEESSRDLSSGIDLQGGTEQTFRESAEGSDLIGWHPLTLKLLRKGHLRGPVWEPPSARHSVGGRSGEKLQAKRLIILNEISGIPRLSQPAQPRARKTHLNP